jgi:hypothetical protein
LNTDAEPYCRSNERRDGNWWLKNPRPAKSVYVLGFFDGIKMGERASTYQLDKTSRDKPEHLTHVTDGQLVNGFGEFYKDPQNRPIKVDEAAIAVLRQIAGDPPDVIKALADTLRNLSKEH